MKKEKHNCPVLGEKILKWFAADHECESFIGDVEEWYWELMENRGIIFARLWYWSQIMKSICVHPTVSFYWRIVMLHNYLKITLRGIKRHKVFAFINITGLAAGLTCCLFISFWIRDELASDRFHEKIDQIYLVRCRMRSGDQIRQTSGTPPLLGSALRDEYPEIVHTVRLFNWQREYLLSYGEKVFKDKILLAEPSIFNVFTFPLVKGSLQELSEPNGLVISERLAAKYFGDEDPVGKRLTIDKQFDVRILGVMKDIPQNSSLRFDAWAPLQLAPKLFNIPTFLDSWGNFAFRTYVELRPEVTPEAFSARIAGRIRQVDKNSDAEPFVYPFKEYYLKLREKEKNVRMFSLIAVLILLMACINFINLATARSEHRAREVGMRKVVGAARQQLALQFLGESILYALLSMVLALILAVMLFPVFQTLTGKNLTIGALLGSDFVFFIMGMTVLTGLISGFYPAFVLSSFHPVRTLRGKTIGPGRTGLLRKVLVLVQSFLSVIFIISFVVISSQIHFMKSRNPGFDRDALLYLPVQGNLKNNYKVMKDELLMNSNIQDVSMTTDVLSYIGSTVTRCRWKGKDARTDPDVTVFGVDSDFIQTFKVDIVQGKFFRRDTHPNSMDVVINEKLANMMSMSSPVGAQISGFGQDFMVIGVVKDFSFRPLDQELEPLIMIHNDEIKPHRYMFIKIVPENMSQTISFIKKVQVKYNSDFPFEYKFLDDEFNDLYRSEEQTRGLVTACMALAVFISSLGLFGLTAFLVERKKKEIGIRKVVGASLFGITLQLSKDFLKWVLLANLIAWPVAYYFMSGWLENFAYRIHITVWIFVLSAGFAFIIALITLSYQSIKAAAANPVDSLRYE